MPSRRAAESTASPGAPGLQLRSKAHQLAGFLREAIHAGRLATPLPGMRSWSQALGVSRRTLHDALKELRAEGLIDIHARGARLTPARKQTGRVRPAVQRIRWLIENTYRRHLHNYHETFSLLQQRLGPRGIELSWESCPAARLRAIARAPARDGELFLLASLPPAVQQVFAAAGKPAIVLGETAPGLELPFINADLAGSVRHATHRFLREGRRQVILVHVKAESVGLRRARLAFDEAGAGWKPHPVHARVITATLDRPSLLNAMQRLAAGITAPAGIIVVAPVPVGLVVTALQQRGIALPERAEIAALMHAPEAVQLMPPPLYYRWPIDGLAREICRATERYFASGALPATGKTLTIERGEVG